MQKEYKFKVDWCQACEQGWIEIQKHSISNQLYFVCSECFVEYDKYEHINEKAIIRETDNYSILEPTDKEIKQNQLWGLIIKEWKSGQMIRNDGVVWKVWSKTKATFVKL